jgi:hypothetical protein
MICMLMLPQRWDFDIDYLSSILIRFYRKHSIHHSIHADWVARRYLR